MAFSGSGNITLKVSSVDVSLPLDFDTARFFSIASYRWSKAAFSRSLLAKLDVLSGFLSDLIWSRSKPGREYEFIVFVELIKLRFRRPVFRKDDV